MEFITGKALDNMPEEELRSANVYIVSLQKNKRMKDYFKKNEILGGHFLEITKPENLNKISDGDMIFIISNGDIDSKFKKELNKTGFEGNVKIILAKKQFRNLNGLGTYIKTKEDLRGIHWLVKQVVETIALPSLVGLDYADIKQLFSVSSIMNIHRFKSNHIEDILRKMGEIRPKAEACFLTVNGTYRMTLDEVSVLGEGTAKFSNISVWGARINEKQKHNFDVCIFVGSK